MADIYGQLVKAQLEHSTSDLSNVSGLVYYKSDTGVVKYYDAVAAAWKTLVDTTTAMTNPLTTTGDVVYSSSGTTPARLGIGSASKSLRVVSGVPAWAWQDTSSAKSADYTVTDTDGITTILMTTGASNRTVTLPTAADNTGRKLVVKKVDSGAGTCIVDGEGAETIDGGTTFTLYLQYASITLTCDGTGWHVTETGSSAWVSFTTTVKYGATTATISTNYSEACQIGKTVHWRFNVAVTNLNAGTGVVSCTLPATASDGAGGRYCGGSMTSYNASDTKYYLGTIERVSTTTVEFITSRSGNGTTANMDDLSNSNHPVNSTLFGLFTYEVA